MRGRPGICSGVKMLVHACAIRLARGRPRSWRRDRCGRDHGWPARDAAAAGERSWHCVGGGASRRRRGGVPRVPGRVRRPDALLPPLLRGRSRGHGANALGLAAGVASARLGRFLSRRRRRCGWRMWRRWKPSLRAGLRLRPGNVCGASCKRSVQDARKSSRCSCWTIHATCRLLWRQLAERLGGRPLPEATPAAAPETDLGKLQALLRRRSSRSPCAATARWWLFGRCPGT